MTIYCIPVFHHLLEIFNKKPDNFAEIVRITVEMFAKQVQSNDKPNLSVSTYCNAICLLLCMSGVPQNHSPWFKSPPLYLSSMIPISLLSKTIYQCLDLSENEQNGDFRNLDEKIIFVKTLLFTMHAPSFIEKSILEPSPYLVSFDFFPSGPFLRSLFYMINNTIRGQKSSSSLLYMRSLISFAIPALYSCSNWKTSLNSLDQNIIHYGFSVLFLTFESRISSTSANRVIESCEQIVSLLYVTILRSPAYLKFIDVNNLTPLYVSSLLFLFQYRFETYNVSFFHSVILLLLTQITSEYQSVISLNSPFTGNFTTNSRPHRGSHVDLLLEIITNPSTQDFVICAPLCPLIACIISNISSTTVDLSFFSANRLFSFLVMLFKTKLTEKPTYVSVISSLLQSLYQFFRFQALRNQSLLLYALERRKLIQELANCKKQSWKDPSSKILTIIDASSIPLQEAAEQRLIKLQNTLAPILKEFVDLPVPLSGLAMSKDVETIWFEWFRVLFYDLFSDDLKTIRQRFSSFNQDAPIESPEPIVTINNEERIEKPKLLPQPVTKPIEFKLQLDSSSSYDEPEPVPAVDPFKIINKKVSTLEELDNPFGSSDEEELAKFLAD